MNYCSINEAWGTNNYISDQFKKHQNPHQNPHQNEIKEIEYFENNNNHYSATKELTCGDFINHLIECSKCQRRLKNKMQNKVVEKFTTLIDDNRDVIVMILAGISIVLFFNLVNNLSK